jgi:hypothetical protein
MEAKLKANAAPAQQKKWNKICKFCFNTLTAFGTFLFAPNIFQQSQCFEKSLDEHNINMKD